MNSCYHFLSIETHIVHISVIFDKLEVTTGPEVMSKLMFLGVKLV